MTAHTTRIVGAAVATMALVAACSTAEGTPTPSGPGSAPSSKSQELPAYGAPRVAEPVEAARLTRFVNDPCSTLSPRQLQQLGLPQGRSVPSSTLDSKISTVCGWTITGSVATPNAKKANISAAFALNGQGLSFFYHNKQINAAAVTLHDEGTVNGFPYIQYQTEQTRNVSACSYFVGVSDQVSLDVGVAQGYNLDGDPCGALLQVTKSITSTLKTGGK